ncbi:MAG: DUF91 domain-containing protein [Gammaproteobacteria bacterium AqS3]|nr:DUF91 domain-containing protein [Gammaproteobacteria bacterium AqS3]
MSNPDRRYFRVILGAKNSLVREGLDGGYIGGGWNMDRDLSEQPAESWKGFMRKFKPVYLERNPGSSKVAAGMDCSALYSIVYAMQEGDIVLLRSGPTEYTRGEITGGYQYCPGEALMHRRSVTWLRDSVQRDDIPEHLHRFLYSGAHVVQLPDPEGEMDALVEGRARPVVSVSGDETVENPGEFAMEAHLEEFLIKNWSACELGERYDILTDDDGALIGQQFPTDTGPIDILARSRDRSEWLVIELKRGRADDAVVGQIQRYMGYIQEEVAEAGQTVSGCIIALQDSTRIRRALQINPSIKFYRYEISFRLREG